MLQEIQVDRILRFAERTFRTFNFWKFSYRA